MGEKPKVKPKGIWAVGEAIATFVHRFFLFGALIDIGGPGAPAAPADKGEKAQLSPGGRVVVEEVEKKAAKPGFKAKLRIVYIAPKEIFSKGKIASGVVGAFKQYTASNLNGFTPDGEMKVGAAGLLN